MTKFARIVGILVLPLPLVAVQVRVVDSESGQPIEGATVISQGSTNKTDASGEAVGKGSKVIAHKSGYVPLAMSWEPSAVPQRFELKLPRAETIGGRVVDGATNPVRNAVIAVIVPRPLVGPRFALEEFPVTSDAEGRWRCDFLPKDPAYVRLEFSHPNFDWPERDFDAAVLRAQTAELKVVPVFALTGRVLGPSGEPVAGATVVLGNDYSVQDEPERRTDAAGKFAFGRQRPQRRLVGIQAEGWAPTLQSVNATSSPVEIRLQKGAPLRVRVEDAAGHPLAGVNVSVSELQGTNSGRWFWSFGEWTTDAQGTVAWTNAPAVACSWSFSKSSYMGRDRLQLRPTSNEVVVTLGPAFSLTGTVVDAGNGRPIPEFALNGRYAQSGSASIGSWYDWTRKTFRDGKFSVYYEQPLLGGSSEMHDWQFRVEADGYGPALSRVIRDSERGTNIAFQLTARPPPQIDVAAPSGKKRVTAAIALQPTNVAPGEIVTVFIKARVAEGHWIYALENSGSENMATIINASLPRALEPEGPWRSPAPKIKPDDSRALAGDVLFSRRYLVEGHTRPQKHKLRFKLDFQVCNDLLCWPPEAIDMETELDIVKLR